MELLQTRSKVNTRERRPPNFVLGEGKKLVCFRYALNIISHRSLFLPSDLPRVGANFRDIGILWVSYIT